MISSLDFILSAIVHKCIQIQFNEIALSKQYFSKTTPYYKEGFCRDFSSKKFILLATWSKFHVKHNDF